MDFNTGKDETLDYHGVKLLSLAALEGPGVRNLIDTLI